MHLRPELAAPFQERSRFRFLALIFGLLAFGPFCAVLNDSFLKNLPIFVCRPKNQLRSENMAPDDVH